MVPDRREHLEAILLLPLQQQNSTTLPLELASEPETPMVDRPQGNQVFRVKKLTGLLLNEAPDVVFAPLGVEVEEQGDQGVQIQEVVCRSKMDGERIEERR